VDVGIERQVTILVEVPRQARAVHRPLDEFIVEEVLFQQAEQKTMMPRDNRKRNLISDRVTQHLLKPVLPYRDHSRIVVPA